MSDVDHHQESCHTLELLESTTDTTVATVENDVVSDCKNNNNNNPDEPLVPKINMFSWGL